MDFEMTLVELIGLMFGAIGVISTVWYFYEKKFPIRKISWRKAEKSAKKIAEKMTIENFSPTLIVGIGRGGAIMGSMISGCLGHRPLLVIDREYKWCDGRRIDDMILHLNIPPIFLEKVFLISGETHTGNTMKLYYEYFKELGAKKIKRSTLYYQKGCTEKIDYIGFIGSKDLRMPWMFTDAYTRDSISEDEACDDSKDNIENMEHDTLCECFLVRHGLSSANDAEDRYSGITDSQLTEHGIKQAEDVGRFLLRKNIQRIYTSPLKRAQKTARIIQNYTGGSLIIDQRLREIDYGDWEGLTREEINSKWPDLYNSYKKNPVKFHPPNADDPQQNLDDMLEFWEELKKTLLKENISRIALVTHKSISRLFLCYLNNIDIKDYRMKNIENASITKINTSINGEIEIEYENRIDHLRSKKITK